MRHNRYITSTDYKVSNGAKTIAVRDLASNLMKLAVIIIIIIMIIIPRQFLWSVMTAKVGSRVHRVHLMNANSAPGGCQPSDQANRLEL